MAKNLTRRAIALFALAASTAQAEPSIIPPDVSQSLGILTRHMGRKMGDDKLGESMLASRKDDFRAAAVDALKNGRNSFDYSIGIGKAFHENDFKGKFAQCVAALPKYTFTASFILKPDSAGRVRIEADYDKPVIVTGTPDKSSVCKDAIQQGRQVEILRGPSPHKPAPVAGRDI